MRKTRSYSQKERLHNNLYTHKEIVDGKCENLTEAMRANEENLLQLAKCLKTDKGYLVRSKMEIPAETILCLYEGEILTKGEYLERKLEIEMDEFRRCRLFELELGNEKVYIDNADWKSKATFFNHVCQHHANIKPIILPTSSANRNQKKFVVAFKTKRKIRANEELAWDYQSFKKNISDGPIWAKCHCGTHTEFTCIVSCICVDNLIDTYPLEMKSQIECSSSKTQKEGAQIEEKNALAEQSKKARTVFTIDWPTQEEITAKELEIQSKKARTVFTIDWPTPEENKANELEIQSKKARTVFTIDWPTAEEIKEKEKLMEEEMMESPAIEIKSTTEMEVEDDVSKIELFGPLEVEFNWIEVKTEFGAKEWILGFENQLKSAKLLQLSDSDWLGTDIMDFYMERICQKESRTHFISNYTIRSLQSGRIEYQKIAKKWPWKLTKETIILTTIHMDSHWTLVLFVMEYKIVEFFDSFNIGITEEIRQVLDVIIKFIDFLATLQGFEERKENPWKFATIEVPEQVNAFDCGPLCLLNARLLVESKPLDYDSKLAAAYFRKKMFLEILEEGMMKAKNDEKTIEGKDDSDEVVEISQNPVANLESCKHEANMEGREKTMENVDSTDDKTKLQIKQSARKKARISQSACPIQRHQSKETPNVSKSKSMESLRSAGASKTFIASSKVEFISKWLDRTQIARQGGSFWRTTIDIDLYGPARVSEKMVKQMLHAGKLLNGKAPFCPKEERIYLIFDYPSKDYIRAKKCTVKECYYCTTDEDNYIGMKCIDSNGRFIETTDCHWLVDKENEFDFKELCQKQWAPIHPLFTLESVKNKLHPSMIPETLLNRENELSAIKKFVLDGLMHQSATIAHVLYISGVPGTGKTATTIKAVKELKIVNKFNFLYVNGLELADSKILFVQLYKKVFESCRHINRLSSRDAQQLLDDYFTQKKKIGNPCVVVIDEVDMLYTKRQDVIYSLFNWAVEENSSLLVIAISNSLDLAERSFSQRIASRMGCNKLIFQPYTFDEIEAILKNRIKKYQFIDDKTIELASKKIASISGDIRKALQLMYRAIDLALEKCEDENDKKDVVLLPENVLEAINESNSSIRMDFIKTMSKHEDLLFRSLVQILYENGIEETIFERVQIRYRKLCSSHLLSPLPILAALEQFRELSICHLVIISENDGALQCKVKLGFPMSEAQFCLRKIDEEKEKCVTGKLSSLFNSKLNIF